MKSIVRHAARGIRLPLILLALLLPAVSYSSTNSSDSRTIRVGAYDNYPKIYVDKSGSHTGIFPDILSEIARREGWKLEYVDGTWGQCLDRLRKGEIDVMVDVAYSEDRAGKYDFSNESTFINWGTVYSREDLKVDGVADLEGLRIAVMNGSIHTVGNQGIKSILDRFNITPSQYMEVDSYKDVFDLLDTGQADAGVVNRIFGAVFEPDYNVQKTSIIFNPRQLHFAFPKKGARTSELKAAIDQGLREMKDQKDSAYYRALDKHLAVRSRGEAAGSPGDGRVRAGLTGEDQKWIRGHPVIRYAIDPEFVPYEFLAEDGSYNGIASDYVKLLSERLGVEFVRVPDLTWVEAVEKLGKGELDFFPCVGKTEERQKYLLFSRPYTKFHRVIITRTDAPFITGVNDIENLRVAVQKDSSNEGFLKDKTRTRPVPHDTLKQALLSVSGGGADAAVCNLAAAAYWIRKLNLTNLKVAAPAGSEELNLHFGVRSDWPELVRIINKGLVTVSPEEEQGIMQRWVGVEFTKGIDPVLIKRYAINIFLIVVVVLTVILIWNYKLKREVARRNEAEEKIRYGGKLKQLISEISASFVNHAVGELEGGFSSALRKIGQMLGGNTTYLYDQVEGRAFSCAYSWQKNSGYDAKACSFLEPTGADAPWRDKEIKAGEVVAVSSVDAMAGGLAGSRAYLKEHGIGSFVEIPLGEEGVVVGLLGVASPVDGREWKPDEISFLRITGQVFSSALMRKNYEQALKRRTAELHEANKRLKELDRLKSMFIASMSHELRTPLNSIIGFTGVILQGMAGELNPTQKDQLTRVHQASRHLLELITDVIDISKIESGRVDVHLKTFPLHEVVQEAVATLKAMIGKKDLRLDLDVPEDIEICSDRKRILQCLINFVSNAVKYTEEGSVSISAKRIGGQVEITVADTGIGIAEQDLPRLFEAFERVDSHLKVKAGGTGLGLYLTRKLITELLGGEVLVKSVPGEGSSFGMRIPATLEHAPGRRPPPGREGKA